MQLAIIKHSSQVYFYENRAFFLVFIIIVTHIHIVYKNLFATLNNYNKKIYKFH